MVTGTSTLKRFVTWATFGSFAAFHITPLWVMAAAGLIPVNEAIEYSQKALFAFLLLLLGLLLGWSGRAATRDATRLSGLVTGPALNVSIWALGASALIVFPWAANQARTLYMQGYGDIDPVHPILNLLMYFQLTLLPVLLLGGWRLPRYLYILLISTVLFPRLMISAFGPRFFLLQALFPTLLYFFCVYRVRLLSPLTVISVSLMAGYLFFLNPILRGDQETLGFQHLAVGSPVNLVTLAEDIGLKSDVVSPFYIPCGILRPLTEFIDCPQGGIVSGRKETYRLDFAMADYVKQITGRDSIGTGGNPLIETGVLFGESLGYLWFLVIGALSGFILKFTYSNFWCLMLFPHVVMKLLFLWRATVVEFFDRIPLILASSGIWFIAVTIVVVAIRSPRTKMPVVTNAQAIEHGNTDHTKVG